MDPVVAGLALVVVGLLLCFLGIGSLHLAVLASGFGIGWYAGDLFGASSSTSLLLALLGALLAWVLVSLVFKLATFFLGVVTGGVIGAKLYEVAAGGDRNAALFALLVVAVAALGGFVADRYRVRALLWLTTLGGASIALTGLARVWPEGLGFLHRPGAGWEHLLAVGCWAALAVAGWVVQRRLFARRLGLPDDDARRR